MTARLPGLPRFARNDDTYPCWSGALAANAPEVLRGGAPLQRGHSPQLLRGEEPGFGHLRGGAPLQRGIQRGADPVSVGAAPSPRMPSTPRIPPAQMRSLIPAKLGVAMAVNAVGGRDNHFAEAHVSRNAGVLEQNAAHHLGAGANAASVAYPAGADDAGAWLHTHTGADVHRAFYGHLIPRYLRIQANPNAGLDLAPGHVRRSAGPAHPRREPAADHGQGRLVKD